MLNKKLLFFSIIIFIMSIASVNAYDVDNGTVVYENQLSTVIVDDVAENSFLQETNDELLSDDNKTVEIICTQVNENLLVSAVDNEGNNLTEGHFLFISENSDEINDYLNGDSFVLLNLYSFPYTLYPQNITIYFDNSDYLANSTFLAYLNNSIAARDVVDESLFSISVFDQNSNPLDYALVGIEIYDDEGTFFQDFSTYSNSKGIIELDLALNPNNYTVYIKNFITSQVSYFWWNITEELQNKKTWINVTVDGYNLLLNVLTYDNNTIGPANVDIYVDDEFDCTVYNNKYLYYALGEGSYNISLYFNENNYYYASNTSLTVNVTDTIEVNDSFYNTSVVDAYILDHDGNPLNNTQIFFHIDENFYVNETDENGHVSYDFNVMPGSYVVEVSNSAAGQFKNVSMEVIEEDINKMAFINVTQDNYKFTVHVTDINGNPIDGGYVLVFQEDMGHSPYLVNGTAVYFYDWSTRGEKEDTLLFVLDNIYYYPVNTTVTFDLVNTIISYDVRPDLVSDASVFNVTLLDMDGNPLAGREVLLTFYDWYNNERYVGNMTLLTDENGFAFVQITDKHFIYQVITDNVVTYQSNLNYWYNQIESNVTPIVDYIDESTGYLYINDTSITFEFSSNATGEVLVFLDIDDFPVYDFFIEDGKISFDFPYIDKFEVLLLYVGTAGFYSKSYPYTVIINTMYTPNMTISQDLVVNYLDEVNFTVNLVNGSKSISNASVEIILGNDTYNLFTDDDGNINVPINSLDAGTYDIFVNYKGNGTYFAVNKTTTLTVNKINLEIVVNKSSISYGDNLYVSVDVNATGNITVEINGELYEANINNSVATIDLSELSKGTYDAKIIYSGDNNYLNSTIDVNITISPIEIDDFNVTSKPVTVGEVVDIEIQLPDDACGNITATVDDKNYTSPVEDGKASILIPDLDVGNYTVPLYYSGDEKYDSLTANASVVVKEDTSDIIIAPDVVKYYGGSERFAVNVTDYKGNPLSNKSVKISINGETYYRTTNQNGTADMAIRLNSGVYNATVTVDNKTLISVVTILPTVNGTDIVKIFRNGTQYSATFRDSEGNYLKDGTVVRFNINGVMYDRTVSGDKGLASLNINLEQGEYIITAINIETGESRANIVTVLPKIVENKDLTKYYRNASQYSVKILGDDGNAVGAGVEVKFNINGVFYTRTTDENGTASLNINLEPGDYIITAEYGGCMVSNNIKVLSVLTASDLIKQYGTDDQFIATLVDGQGMPYSNQKIEFNINGVFYYRTTDSTGQAQLNINLMQGIYIITSSYNGLNIANNVIVTD